MTNCMTTMHNPVESSYLKIESAVRMKLLSKIHWPQYQRFIWMKFLANDPRK